MIRSGGGYAVVSIWEAISLIDTHVISTQVSASDLTARAISSCPPYPIARITIISVFSLVRISASIIFSTHTHGRSERSQIQTIRTPSFCASFAISSIPYSSSQKRYLSSSGSRFAILSSDRVQKLANGIPRFLVSRIIRFAVSYHCLCHSSVGSHLFFAQLLLPSMM